MIFIETKLTGAFIVDIDRRPDSRGFFARTFCHREFVEHGLTPNVAQANIAFNTRRGTLRGMHFQFPPAAETKLVRVTRGALLDVIVDLRPESATFLEHVAVVLSADNRRAVYVPERFAHGYQVLADNTEATYEMGDFYAPDLQGGLRYSDPSLAIAWPLTVSEISAKDAELPLLADVEADLRRQLANPALTSSSHPG